VVRDRGLNRPPSWVGLTAACVPIAVIVAFVVIPATALVARTIGTDWPQGAFDVNRTVFVVGSTVAQAALSTILTILLGLGPGIVVARYHFQGRTTLVSALTAVFVMPTVVIAAGVRSALPAPLDSGWSAVVIAHVVFNLAVVVRIVGSTPMPGSLERTARTLGAGPIDVLRTVTLPLIAPAVAASAAMVFALSFTSYGVVRILGSHAVTTIEVEIWRETVVLGRVDRGTFLALVQVVVLAIVAGAWILLRHRRRPAPFIGETPRRAPRWIAAVIAPLVIVMVTPFATLAIGSVRVTNGVSLSAWRAVLMPGNARNAAIGIDPLHSLMTSIRIAAIAAAIAVLLSLLVIVAVATTNRLGRIAGAVVMVPLGLSAVTVALGILITYDTAPFDWRASRLIVPLGHAVISLPFVVRPAIAALRSVNAQTVDTALILGARPQRARLTAYGPAVTPVLLTGAGLAMAISLGEFGATSLLSRSGNETLPIVIDRMLARTGGDFRARAHALAVVLAGGVITLTVMLDRARMTRRQRP
jgi:thiamine transport system permease protein